MTEGSSSSPAPHQLSSPFQHVSAPTSISPRQETPSLPHGVQCKACGVTFCSQSCISSSIASANGYGRQAAGYGRRAADGRLRAAGGGRWTVEGGTVDGGQRGQRATPDEQWRILGGGWRAAGGGRRATGRLGTDDAPAAELASDKRNRRRYGGRWAGNKQGGGRRAADGGSGGHHLSTTGERR